MRSKRKSRRAIKSCLLGLCVLAMMILATCATPVRIGRTLPPKPELRYGWGPESTKIINGKEERVRCMTVDDIERLRQYIMMLETP